MTINCIEPTNWFVGMKNPCLQLMVYGKGIASVKEVTTDYPGVRVERVVRLHSHNYLFVYLNLQKARPGTMVLRFDGIEVAYQLKEREKAGSERMGFTNADVLYLLMPDRFAQGKGHPAQVKGMQSYREDRSQPSLRHGGDLNGIREHLDYFTELGVTALWLTPVLENNSPDDPRGFSTYHGYAVTNFYRVDPRLGSNADYRRLVDEAHQRGLKVVMDMIFNHCSIDHPWIKDLPSEDWLNTAPDAVPCLQTSYKLTPVLDPYASEIDKRETVEGWFVPSMPDLNQHNPHLMRYLIQNSFWWIETIGIDGIRMDTYPYAYADAMAEWMKELNNEYPHFNVVGETWVTEPAYSAAWQKDFALGARTVYDGNGAPGFRLPNSHLKTVMDFSFFDKMNKAKQEETDDWWLGLNRIYHSFVYDYLYPDPSSVLAFLDNHDTNRFLHKGRDVLALKQALALLLTVNRIPQIYYGTEVLMNGTTEVSDGYVRKDFPGGFPGDRQNLFERKNHSQTVRSVFSWLSQLLHWRQHCEAVIKGRQTQFIPHKGVYVIARQYQEQTVLIILNGTSQPATMSVKRYAEVIGSAGKVKDVLSHRFYNLSSDVKLRPRQTLVLDFSRAYI